MAILVLPFLAMNLPKRLVIVEQPTPPFVPKKEIILFRFFIAGPIPILPNNRCHPSFHGKRLFERFPPHPEKEIHGVFPGFYPLGRKFDLDGIESLYPRFGMAWVCESLMFLGLLVVLPIFLERI